MINFDHNESLGRLQLPVPVGWISQHQITLELPFEPHPELAFRPNIVVSRQAHLPPATLDSLVAERVRLLAGHLPGFVADLALSGSLVGRRAVSLTYTWRHASGQLRQLCVLGMLDHWLYELTFSDLEARFAASVVEFERWLARVTSSAEPVARAALLFGRP